MHVMLQVPSSGLSGWVRYPGTYLSPTVSCKDTHRVGDRRLGELGDRL